MYLHSKGDVRLDHVMREIAQINGKQHVNVSVDEVPKLENGSIQPQRETHLISIFRRPYLSTTIIQSIQYFTCNFAYYGMVLFMPMILPKTTTLESYTVILIQQICKVYVGGMIGCFVAAFSINTVIGRKGSEAIGFLVAGIFIYPFMSSDSLPIVNNMQIYTFSSLISLFQMIGQSSMYTHSQELYPTHIRGLGVGWLTGICLMTAVITPPIIGVLQELADNQLVLGICGACFLIAGSVSFLLVESSSEREVYIQKE